MTMIKVKELSKQDNCMVLFPFAPIGSEWYNQSNGRVEYQAHYNEMTELLIMASAEMNCAITDTNNAMGFPLHSREVRKRNCRRSAHALKEKGYYVQ